MKSYRFKEALISSIYFKININLLQILLVIALAGCGPENSGRDNWQPPTNGGSGRQGVGSSGSGASGSTDPEQDAATGAESTDEDEPSSEGLVCETEYDSGSIFPLVAGIIETQCFNCHYIGGQPPVFEGAIITQSLKLAIIDAVRGDGPSEQMPPNIPLNSTDMKTIDQWECAK